jgi:cytochrome c5
MKRAAVIVGTLVLLGYAVWMGLQPRPRPAPPRFAFAAQSIALPASTEALPPGPHLELVQANCLSCHSAMMLTTQPALKREQWEAIVKKMREVYKAPIADADVAPAIDYLTSMSNQVERTSRAPEQRHSQFRS